MTNEPINLVAVGDTTLDVTVRATAAPAAGRDIPVRISLGPGGQGANLCIRLARRGGRARLVAPIGDDAAGRLLRQALAEDGVELVRLPADRTGVVVSLIDAGGERAMLSDRVGFALEAMADPALDAALTSAGWVHVSGYPLADERSADRLAALVATRQTATRCSVGGGSFATGAGLEARIRTMRPDLLLFDRAEASAVLSRGPPANDPPAAADLAVRLARAFDAVAVVTDGRAGAAAAMAEGSLTMPGWEGAPAVDSTGAGDAHAAALLLALAPAAWPPPLPALRDALAAAARLGAEVAGVVGAQGRVGSEGTG